MDKVQLLNDLSNGFNETEFKELCLKLDINDENLDGANLKAKKLSLIQMMERHARLSELVATVLFIRPFLRENYPDIIVDVDPDQIPQAEETQSDQAVPRLGMNPFVFGPKITDKAMFFGRQMELQRLSAHLQNMSSCSIVSLRRIGKSSLLYYLSEFSLPQAQYFLTAYIDLQEANYHSRNGLLNGILTSWFEKLGRLPPNVTSLREFSLQVQQLRGEGLKPIVCLDEFERLSMRPQEFNEDLFESWRALASNGTLVFVTTSQKPLGDLIKQSGLTSNFDNIFVTVDLGLLTENEAKELVLIPFRRAGIELDETEADRLVSLAGRYPFYLQMAAFYQFEAKQIGVSGQNHVAQHFLQQAERHWRGLWRALPQQEQIALHAVLGVALAAPNTPTFLQRLARKGVVVAIGQSYQLFSDAFAQFIATEPATVAAANLAEPNRAMQQRFQTLHAQKASLDKKAEKYGRGYMLKFAGGLSIFYVGLALLTVGIGWERMEPFTYFLSATGIIGMYVWLALTQQEWNPGLIFARIVESKRRELYIDNGFDEAEYGQLQAAVGEDA